MSEIAKPYNFSLIPEPLLSYAAENIESPDYTNAYCWVILTNTLNNIFDITFCSHTDNLDVIEWVDQESVLKILHFLTHRGKASACSKGNSAEWGCGAGAGSCRSSPTSEGKARGCRGADPSLCNLLVVIVAVPCPGEERSSVPAAWGTAVLQHAALRLHTSTEPRVRGGTREDHFSSALPYFNGLPCTALRCEGLRSRTALLQAGGRRRRTGNELEMREGPSAGPAVRGCGAWSRPATPWSLMPGSPGALSPACRPSPGAGRAALYLASL